MVSLQIRHLVGPGDLASTDYAFAEQGMHSIAWLGVALVLFRLEGDGVRSFVVRWGWRVLGALAAVQVLVLQLVVDNPVFTGTPVGDVPIVNDLLFAFGGPAILELLFAAASSEARRVGKEGVGTCRSL